MNWKDEKRQIDNEGREAARDGKKYSECPYSGVKRSRWSNAYAQEMMIIAAEREREEFYDEKYALCQSIEEAQNIEELKKAVIGLIEFLYEKEVINKKELEQ